MDAMSSPSRKLSIAQKASMAVRSMAGGIVAATVTPLIYYRNMKRYALDDRPVYQVNWERIGAHFVDSGMLTIVMEELLFNGESPGRTQADRPDAGWPESDQQVH